MTGEEIDAGVFVRAKNWARRVKLDVVTVYFAARDPRTPPGLRLLAVAIAAYALSPIDLIPDFIPILGYLDDVLIVPAGIWLVMRLLEPAIVADSRAQATALLHRPKSTIAACFVVMVWLLAIGALAYWLFDR